MSQISSIPDDIHRKIERVILDYLASTSEKTPEEDRHMLRERIVSKFREYGPNIQKYLSDGLRDADFLNN